MVGRRDRIIAGILPGRVDRSHRITGRFLPSRVGMSYARQSTKQRRELEKATVDERDGNRKTDRYDLSPRGKDGTRKIFWQDPRRSTGYQCTTTIWTHGRGEEAADDERGEEEVSMRGTGRVKVACRRPGVRPRTSHRQKVALPAAVPRYRAGVGFHPAPPDTRYATVVERQGSRPRSRK